MINKKFNSGIRNITYLPDEKKWIMVDPTEGIVKKDNRGVRYKSSLKAIS